MSHWLYPANVKYYDVFGAFKQAETYLPVNSKVSVDDVVYIYIAAPHKQVGFVTQVREIGLEHERILDKVQQFIKGEVTADQQAKEFMKLKKTATIMLEIDSVLAYSLLKENGLNGMLMGPRKHWSRRSNEKVGVCVGSLIILNCTICFQRSSSVASNCTQFSSGFGLSRTATTENSNESLK